MTITDLRRPDERPSLTPESAGRTLWIVFGSIFTVAALVYGTYTTIGTMAFARTSTHVQIEAADAAAITSVDIRSGAGSAQIIGSERDDIVVDAKVVYGLSKPDNDTRVEGDTLVVSSSCPTLSNTWCDVDYTVYVPASVAVRARASGGGLRIEGIDGDVNGSSSGGGVRVIDAGGSLDLDSSGGGVRGERLRSPVVRADSSGGGVRLSFSEAPASVDAGAAGGGVTIEVPEPHAYNIDAESSGGDVDVDGVRHDPTSDRMIFADSSGGVVTVRYATQ